MANGAWGSGAGPPDLSTGGTDSVRRLWRFERGECPRQPDRVNTGPPADCAPLTLRHRRRVGRSPRSEVETMVESTGLRQRPRPHRQAPWGTRDRPRGSRPPGVFRRATEPVRGVLPGPAPTRTTGPGPAAPVKVAPGNARSDGDCGAWTSGDSSVSRRVSQSLTVDAPALGRSRVRLRRLPRQPRHWLGPDGSR